MTSNEIASCEDALRLLAAHLDRELDDHDHHEVERHLEACRSCYSRAEFERRLKASVKTLDNEPVRPELANRIDRLLTDFTLTADN